MFKSALVSIGIAVSIALAGLLSSSPVSRAITEATPQGGGRRPPTLFQLMQAVHTGNMDGYFDPVQGPGSVWFLGWDCDNSFDLTKETLSSHGFDANIAYSYMDGKAVHDGNTANPNEAVRITDVCWAMFFFRDVAGTPVG